MFSLLIIITTSVLLVIYIFLFSHQQSKHNQIDALLQQNINLCDGIAEKSVLELPELLEFQKMEKQGRKARVMQLCMSDRGYIISKTWMNRHHQQAIKIATEMGVSEDAALEQIKREVMYQSPATPNDSIWAKAN